MSEGSSGQFSAAVRLSATEEIQRTAPPWLAEVAVLAAVWVSSGLLEKLCKLVRVPRGRMGKYEECDFVLVLLGYAASGEKTLLSFYKRLEGFEPVLGGLWGRVEVPSRSALSRFLEAVTPEALEKLREILFEDLLRRGVEPERSGGLLDRLGQRHVLFDMDGTKQTARQRSLVQTQEYPPVRRRLEPLCAPGYVGRGRGEVVRTRTAVQQAHTSEWLGTFGGAGNGQFYAELGRGCEAVRAYLAAQRLSPSAALVRLDGLYGYVPSISIVTQAGLQYIVRCVDYGLLRHLRLIEKLAELPAEDFEMPDTGTHRLLYDAGVVRWQGTGRSELVLEPRLIVSVRSPGAEERSKPKIGKRIGASIYELFVTGESSAEALRASDVLSLYFGRGGGVENAFKAEDYEQEPDRWCSGHAAGQEWWQVLSQWLWNERLRLGAMVEGWPQRRTLWAEALPAEAPLAGSEPGPCICEPMGRSPQPLALVPAAATLPLLPEAEPLTAATLPAAEPPSPGTVLSGRGRGAGRFGAEHFTFLNSRALLCPAGKHLRPRETRLYRGEPVTRFQARASDCRSCPLASQCLGGKSLCRRGRSVSVVHSPAPPISDSLPASSAEAQLPTPAQPAHLAPSQPSRPALPVLWDDLPATALRRLLPMLLLTLRFDLDVPGLFEPPCPAPALVLTRAQRAHRRLPYPQRLARNAFPSTARSGSIHIHGLPFPVSRHLAALGHGARDP